MSHCSRCGDELCNGECELIGELASKSLSRFRMTDEGLMYSHEGGPYKPFKLNPPPSVWDVGRHVARACASMDDRDSALRLILTAPCLWCGYNGQGYWSLRTHAESCPWYEIGGHMERLLVLGAYQPREDKP